MFGIGGCEEVLCGIWYKRLRNTLNY